MEMYGVAGERGVRGLTFLVLPVIYQDGMPIFIAFTRIAFTLRFILLLRLSASVVG
jgi:hypothetical protein